MEPSGFISKDEIETVYRSAAAVRLPGLGLGRGLGRILIAMGERLAGHQLADKSPQIATEPC